MSEADLPLLEVDPAVSAAVKALKAGDHATARQFYADIDRNQLTAADAESMRLLDAGLRFDWAPIVVMGLAFGGWLFLLLRAI